ncbi:MAG: hypothetical protein A2913_02255 [Parcubacteria group bacterium RIFCSPLOWO2_01_FULL_40_65]|nr:MAG: hypothetical protein A2734_00435 [Parcubacteria group bacterium RIFCSPHIGHO2_01_FULL_40_30]OHB19597.1 MAG: hypothetical protein A3D40_01920 [Parcubacteria group bacterium RIFCSPHIGHO2_02_FULL_40_12]OHB21946.1 MAG: hypothetical protein A2913_02255 [Parcubacteria group bacterium RIFCSPLOWO2_01_FULL_40_65]OHB23743.1 MAG: hypothetical protein A3I22_00985 [Parcubacteria group bacterium RIFCSPLOWO2_02_FULL_40_12]OHB24330.1 MAG: hypothetical protein A3F96_00605 [Parcubacteria group bacterium R
MLNLGESKTYNPYSVYVDQIKSDQIKYIEFHNKLKQSLDSTLDFVFSTGPADFIKDRISIPLNLNQSQSKEIAKIVMEIIVADSYLGNIIEQIRQRVIVDEQKAKIIAGLIVAELFAPILDELKKIHIEKFAKMAPKQNFKQQIDKVPGGDDSVIDLRKEFKV